jgi:hypothetical protein
MYTTVNEDGVLNNYATEPQMHYAEYPTIWEQRKYVVQGVFATFSKPKSFSQWRSPRNNPVVSGAL